MDIFKIDDTDQSGQKNLEGLSTKEAYDGTSVKSVA